MSMNKTFRLLSFSTVPFVNDSFLCGNCSSVSLHNNAAGVVVSRHPEPDLAAVFILQRRHYTASQRAQAAGHLRDALAYTLAYIL